MAGTTPLFDQHRATFGFFGMLALLFAFLVVGSYGYVGALISFLVVALSVGVIAKGPTAIRRRAVFIALFGVASMAVGFTRGSSDARTAHDEAAKLARGQDIRRSFVAALSEMHELTPEQRTARCQAAEQGGGIPAEHAATCANAWLDLGSSRLANKDAPLALVALQKASAQGERSERARSLLADAEKQIRLPMIDAGIKQSKQLVAKKQISDAMVILSYVASSVSTLLLSAPDSDYALDAKKRYVLQHALVTKLAIGADLREVRALSRAGSDVDALAKCESARQHVALLGQLVSDTKLVSSLGKQIEMEGLSIEKKIEGSKASDERVRSIVGEKPKNSAWDGSVAAVERFLEANLKDPESLKFVDWSPVTLSSSKRDPYWAVRARYRAKNSFGGYVVEQKLFLIRQGQVVSMTDF